MLEETKEKVEAAAKKGEKPVEKYYFKCRSNKKRAVILTFDNFWEAEEMKKNPDYFQVDADGDLILNPADHAPQQLPMMGQRR